MRSELQKAALEALIEVRRETLNRAFNSGSIKMSDEVSKMLGLERALEESQVRGGGARWGCAACGRAAGQRGPKGAAGC